MFIRLAHILLFSSIGLVSVNPSTYKAEEERNDQKEEPKELRPPFLESNTHQWADSILDSLTLDQKIGQLFMVAAYSNKDQAHVNEIKKLVKDYEIGGLIFMQGTPEKQIELNNTYQSLANIPLMIAIDGEWGLPMRLKNTHLFPKQMTMGAVQYDSLIYNMGKEMALHCKRMGIHVNFAPVVDINTNPKNPIINYRSFGEDRDNVANKGIAYMKGMQHQGVLACGKHFPGHGDTDTDSHKALPVIKHDKKRLDSIELYPFKKLTQAGLGSMMVAHLYIPAYDSTKNTATTLSKNVVTTLLRDSLKFEGLAFTDALNMKGVSAYFEPGVVDVKALVAGNDVLLFSEDVPTAIKEIKKALETGEVTEEQITQTCKRILYAKQWLKVNNDKISVKNIKNDLNPASSDRVNRLLYENSLTLVKNEENLLPLKNLDKNKVLCVTLGGTKNNVLHESLSRYGKVDLLELNKKGIVGKVPELQKKFYNYGTIIISVHQTRMNGSYGITSEVIKFIEQVAQKNKVILNFPTNPYALAKFDSTKNIKSIIVSYEDNSFTQDAVAQLIFGGISAKGKLPVTASSEFALGTGLNTEKVRLSYTDPSFLEMNLDSLAKIDELVEKSITDSIFPGCQILVARKGQVVYNKAFGYHTYNKKNEVSLTDLYDIASVTKVAVTTPIIMKTHEEGSITLNHTLHDFLPDVVDSTDYEKVIISDMLAHQARFTPWIPFYTSTMTDGKLNPRFYKSTKTSFYNTEVAKDIYIFKNYKKAILKRIVDTKLRSQKKYKYSDIGYYFLKEIIERETKATLDRVIDSMYFKELGMDYTLYNPKQSYKLSQIVPTEDDQIFRKQLVHGYVHDQGAAMMGGVGGHAGLFSNANDLAKLCQMYLNGGTYGGTKFLNDTTIKKFTTANHKNNDNRRGYGFDKPLENLDGGPTSKYVSLASYGHSGFTGTRIWIDPKEELIYIFLSNRVHPDAENWKLVRENIRTRIEEIIYRSFKARAS